MVLGRLCDSFGRVVDALASAQQECVKAEEAVAKIAKSMILFAYRQRILELETHTFRALT